MTAIGTRPPARGPALGGGKAPVSVSPAAPPAKRGLPGGGRSAKMPDSPSPRLPRTAHVRLALRGPHRRLRGAGGAGPGAAHRLAEPAAALAAGRRRGRRGPDGRLPAAELRRDGTQGGPQA